jgi:hypothetical protein
MIIRPLEWAETRIEGVSLESAKPVDDRVRKLRMSLCPPFQPRLELNPSGRHALIFPGADLAGGRLAFLLGDKSR